MLVLPEKIIDLDVCLRHIQYSVLTDHQASSRAATIPIELRQRGTRKHTEPIFFGPGLLSPIGLLGPRSNGIGLFRGLGLLG